MNEEIKRNVIAVCVGILIIIIIFGMVYARMTSRLSIIRNSENTKNWKIKFANLEKVVTFGTAKELQTPTINNLDTRISVYEVSLTSPGDKIIYRFDVVNEGDYDALIGNINVPTPICIGIGEKSTLDASNVCNHLHYTLKYADGVPVTIGDTLYSGKSRKLVLTLEYDDLVGVNELALNNVKIRNLDVDIIYVQCVNGCNVAK